MEFQRAVALGKLKVSNTIHRTIGLARSARLIWREFVFRPYMKRKTIEDVTFDFYIGNVEGMDWYDIQASDPKWDEMRHIRDLLIKEGDVVFELGSHHGCTTILLANWVGPGGKVIAFEPGAINVSILEKNIEMNQLGNVEIRRQAAGEVTKNARFSNMSILLENRNQRCEEIEMIQIDDLKHLRPTVLKLDVQGYEVNVLKGAQEILRTRPKLAVEILCTLLKYYGHSVEDLLNLLNLEEYESWILYSDEEEVMLFEGNPERMKRYQHAHLFAVPKAVR